MAPGMSVFFHPRRESNIGVGGHWQVCCPKWGVTTPRIIQEIDRQWKLSVHDLYLETLNDLDVLIGVWIVNFTLAGGWVRFTSLILEKTMMGL